MFVYLFINYFFFWGGGIIERRWSYKIVYGKRCNTNVAKQFCFVHRTSGVLTEDDVVFVETRTNRNPAITRLAGNTPPASYPDATDIFPPDR